MGIVFEGYPNIHGRSEDYSGGGITQKMTGNHFQGIKSRYLATMRAQLIAQNGSQEQDYLQGLSDAKFEELEGAIEAALVSSYNSMVGSLGSSYMGIVSNIDSGIKNQNQMQVISALNQLIGLFKFNGQPIGLINEINSQGLIPIPAELSEILGIKNIVNAISRIESGELKYSSQWINSLIAPSSEVVAAYANMVDSFAEITVDEFISQLANTQLGTSKLIVPVNFGKGGQKSIEVKAADIRLQNIQFSTSVGMDSAGVHGTVTLNVDPYATVKTIRGNRQSLAKMISYAGQNSIVINLLHQIYGTSSEVDYHLYNSLAFSKTSGAGNYKIFRSDMTAIAAEKYIIGYGNTQAQQILIHNFTAYPILAILSAIAEQAVERTQDGDSQYVNNAIFNISFENLGSINNSWRNQKTDPPSKILKLARIKEVKATIDSLSTRGYLNLNQLNNFVSSGQVEGISLAGIVPNTGGKS